MILKNGFLKKEELDKYTFEAAKIFEVKDNFSNKRYKSK